MWAVTAANGKAIPLDPFPAENGNVRIENVDGRKIAHVANRDQRDLFAQDDVPLYLAHFATCEKIPTRPGG